MNGDHSVIFEIASKYCILDSFVDYEDYSINGHLNLIQMTFISTTVGKNTLEEME